MSDIGLANENILTYEDIYNITDNIPVTHIKLKIIQEMIQIIRPSGWNKSRVIDVINSIVNTEKYLAIKNRKVASWQSKWNSFLKINK
jgi:hypothetical protein